MDILKETTNWLEKTIIGLNLCPFAKEPYKNNLVNIAISQSTKKQDLIKSFLEIIQEMEMNPSPEYNTIWVLNKLNYDFDQFYEFVSDLEDELFIANKKDKYHLIVFHPKFRFDKLKEDDLANYVNRSPFPIVHILKPESFDSLNIKDVEVARQLSLNNENKLKNLSKDQINEYFWFLKD